MPKTDAGRKKQKSDVVAVHNTRQPAPSVGMVIDENNVCKFEQGNMSQEDLEKLDTSELVAHFQELVAQEALHDKIERKCYYLFRDAEHSTKHSTQDEMFEAIEEELQNGTHQEGFRAWMTRYSFHSCCIH